MRLLLVRHPSILATLTVVLALVLHGTLVGAEERKLRNLTIEPYLRADETVSLIAISSAFDAWTALDLIERSEKRGLAYRELAPLGQSEGKILALQFARVGAGVLVVHEVDRRWGRKWGKRVLWTITGIGFGAAAVQLAQARGRD